MPSAASMVLGKLPGANPSLGSGGRSPRIVSAMPLPVTRASPNTMKGLEASFQSLSCPDSTSDREAASSSMGLAQHGLRPLMLGDVLKDHAALPPGRRNRPFDPHLDRRLAFLEERHFAELAGLALEDPREEGGESGPVGRGNERTPSAA